MCRPLRYPAPDHSRIKPCFCPQIILVFLSNVIFARENWTFGASGTRGECSDTFKCQTLHEKQLCFQSDQNNSSLSAVEYLASLRFSCLTFGRMMLTKHRNILKVHIYEEAFQMFCYCASDTTLSLYHRVSCLKLSTASQIELPMPKSSWSS